VDTIENGEKKGYYVYATQKKDALDGDEVSFSTKVFKGKQEAVIEKVLKRSDGSIV